MNIHMSSKNTKTKTATTTETKKQTAGSEKVTAVPNANTIVEKKMEDKVVAVEKKADKKTEAKSETKKGGAKVEATATPAPAPTPTPVAVAPATKTAKKGGAKVEATPVPVVAAPVAAPTKAAKKGGAKVEAVPVAEAKTEKKADAKKGGAKKAPKAEAKTEKKAEKKVDAAQDDEEEGEVAGTKLRYFKLIYNDEVQGRYCGKKPKQAANKAFSSIIKELKKSGQQNGGVNVDLNFSIRECTRNSKHKEYRYIGKRQVLENPVQVKIANGDGSVKQIEYKFHNKLQKAPKA